MIRWLVNLGLIVTPFLCLEGSDTRYPKQIFALGISLIIALLGIYQGTIKSFPNKFSLIFIGYLFISTLFVPKFTGLFLGNGGNMDGLWNYRALFHILVYFLALVVIANMSLNRMRIESIFKIMAYCGFFMSLYIFIQALGTDQLFHVKPYEKIGYVTNPSLVGTLGQPTIVSPFILMCIPMALYLKKYWMVIAMVAAIILTKSDIAVGAMGLMAYTWFFTRNTMRFVVGSSALIIFVLTLIFFQIGNPLFLKNLVNDNGRFDVWVMALKDVFLPFRPEISSKSFVLTGLGFGSFEYIFPVKHANRWMQAHNEYIQLLYGTGVIGLMLGLSAIGEMIKKALAFARDKQLQCLLFGFLAMVLCALGTFVWQLGTHIFYTIVIAGLILNLIRRNKCVLIQG